MAGKWYPVILFLAGTLLATRVFGGEPVVRVGAERLLTDYRHLVEGKRVGVTVGELARMMQGEEWHENLENLDLHVVLMDGWSRDTLWQETGLPWVPPSPNIPNVETALVYPGTCFLEGTTASEGRGTREPFLQVGAAGIDGRQVADELNGRNLPGVRFTPARFMPTSIPGMSREPKLEGEEVTGVRLEVTGARKLEPVAAGIHLLDALYHALPEADRDSFFNRRGMAIRAGKAEVQEMIEAGVDAREIIDAWEEEVAAFARQREPYLLYE